MSDLLSVLNDDQAMVRGISGVPNPRLREVLDGLQPDDPVILTRLHGSGLLDAEATTVVGGLIETWPRYKYHRLRLSDVRTSTHPFAHYAGINNPWAKNGNLYCCVCPIGGGSYGESLHIWLCLAEDTAG